MEKPDLCKLLENMGTDIEVRFDNVNFGGCCVVAVAIAEHLRKITRVKIRVAVPSWGDSDSVSFVRNHNKPTNYKDWNSGGLYFDHIFVEFDWEGQKYFVDSEGVYPVDKKPIREGIKAAACIGTSKLAKGFLKFKEAKALAADANAWNKRFNRGQIPKILDLIDKTFKEKIYPVTIE